jgi:hypothetical protein
MAGTSIAPKPGIEYPSVSIISRVAYHSVVLEEFLS